MTIRNLGIFLVSLMVAVGTLFAGGQQEPESETVELRILTRWSGSDSFAPLLQAAIEEYEAMHPNVNIINESINDEAAFNNKFRTDLATGNLPAIFAVNGLVLEAEYAESGLLLDVTEYLEADPEWSDGLSDAALSFFDKSAYGVPGIYGIPVASAIEVFYYNKDLFEEANISVPPATFEELVEGLLRIREMNAIPWAVGGADTWRVGHIHNALLYKLNGVDIAPDLGFNRAARWTDPEVVESLERLLELKEIGLFEDGFEAISYDTEQATFLAGEAGVTFNGTWFIGSVVNAGVEDNVGAFLFPSLEDHPEYEGHNIVFPQGLNINANLTPEQEEHAVGFVKHYTSPEVQMRMAYETQNLPVRTDIELDPARLSDLFVEINALVSDIERGASDSFGYDPLAAMQDRTRNSFIGMMLGNTPMEAAEEIQAEIDERSN